MAEKNFFKHWPTMLLGFIVAAILLVAVFSFQLPQTQYAVVTTFGKPKLVTEPGLHFRWPYPFQRVYTFDKRVRCFSGGEGKLEETMTKDGHNILVGIYVTFRISDAEKFFTSLENMTKAENQLNSWMRSARGDVFGNYNFDQIVNTDPKKMKLAEIQADILAKLKERAKSYGLEIISVGINTINVPKSNSEEVFKRMIAERQKESKRIIDEAEKEAKGIRAAANEKAKQIKKEAEAQAKETRGKADKEAAEYYKQFASNPELAEFLRKLDALRKVMKGRTTLVVDTNTPPFDLLKPDALNRSFRKSVRNKTNKPKAKVAPKTEAKPEAKPKTEVKPEVKPEANKAK